MQEHFGVGAYQWFSREHCCCKVPGCCSSVPGSRRCCRLVNKVEINLKARHVSFHVGAYDILLIMQPTQKWQV